MTKWPTVRCPAARWRVVGWPATARRLVRENGFEIRAEKSTVTPLELIFGMPADHWLMKAMNRCLAVITNLLPGLFAYQIMFVARVAPQKP